MTSAPRFLVIGSNSFSGASFARHLLEQGYETVGASHSAEPDPVFLPYRWSSGSAPFRFRQVDLNHDLDALDSLLQDYRPTHVVNFAAQSMVAESWQNPDQWFQTNLVSTVRLHDRLRRLSSLERYVHISTPEVYGSTQGLVGEDTPFNPSTPYAVSRAAADFSLRTYHQAYDFPVVTTRAANVYGPGQQLYRIIPKTFLSIRGGQKLQLHGGGVSERAFIHIDDVSAATLKIALSGRNGEDYHVSTDRIIRIRDLVALICERLGVAFEEAVEVAEERPGKDAAYRLDSRKLTSELGWRSRIGLEEGLSDVGAWIDRNIEVLSQMPQTYQHKA
jgi:dTDP-glucose 4,6-dehydratase